MKRLTCVIWIALCIAGLAACSMRQPYTSMPTATSTPAGISLPAPLPDGERGFFLVSQGEVQRLPAQGLSESRSIYLANLPKSEDAQPRVLVRLTGVDPDKLKFWRMLGSVGIFIEADQAAGGMRVKGTRPGFGADAGGLKAGDVIVSVEGEELAAYFNFVDAADRFAAILTGELGSQVGLTVRRDGEEVALRLLRNFPTALSLYKPLEFEHRQAEGGVIVLTPEQALPEGVYCYHTQPATFYCFTRGELSLAQPTPPALLGGEISTDAHPLVERANFIFTSCRFPTLGGQRVTCADLSVPEDRRYPQRKTIQLHVAIFHAPYGPQADAVIYLHGGPGASALAWMAGAYASGFQYMFPDRDLIVFDQRGVGYSQPRLACDSPEDYASSLARDERVSMLVWNAQFMDACRERLESQGVDLGAYDSRASANDLHDLIQALGYEQVNLFGQSGGTYLALAYLKAYGEEGGVRSVILDGVIPLQVNLFEERTRNAGQAFETLFAACQADPACKDSYPDLQARFYSLLEHLAMTPVTVRVDGLPVVLNDYRLIEAVYRLLYDESQITRIPAMLAGIEQGDYLLFSQALGNVLAIANGVDDGIYYAIMCSDQAAYARDVMTGSSIELLKPELQGYFRGTNDAMQAVCANWSTAAFDPEHNQPVESDVPVLLLSGAFDPVTPPEWGRLAAESLSRGYAFAFPTSTHDLLSENRCAQAVAAKFVTDPVEPNDPCIEDHERVEFYTP